MDADPGFEPAPGPHLIVFWPDGSDLRMTTRYIGPFPDFSTAYDYLCTLPAPIKGGHKFIHSLEAPV